jgi:lipoprotein Spr
MKRRFFFIVVCICILFVGNACKHRKKMVTTEKADKHKIAKKDKNTPDTGSKAATVHHSEAARDVLAKKVGLSEKEIYNNRLFVFIYDWYGVPYKYGGCLKTGIDCSCFTNLLYDKVYNKKTGRSADEIYKACEKITLNEVREGDLLFFKINGTVVSHVGVYLRNNMFVHSSTSKGVVISSIEEAYYKKFFHSGGRLKSS